MARTKAKLSAAAEEKAKKAGKSAVTKATNAVKQTKERMSDWINAKTELSFTSVDVDKLTQNENGRYFPSSQRIAHALVSRSKDEAYQFLLPAGTDPKTPVIHQVSNLEEIEVEGMARYRATDPDGKKWHGVRSDVINIRQNVQETEYDLVYLSPDDEGQEVDLRASQRIARRRNESLANAKIRSVRREIDPNYVRAYDQNPQKPFNQNQIMGRSACVAYDSYSRLEDEDLTKEMIGVLRDNAGADINVSPKNNYRTEWRYLDVRPSLAKPTDPPTKNDFAAIPMWGNVSLMHVEKVGARFALEPGASTRIEEKLRFVNLGDSDLLDHVHMELDIECNEKKVTIIKDVDPFQQNVPFPKVTDNAQLAGITHQLLHSDPDYYKIPVQRTRLSSASQTMFGQSSQANSTAGVNGSQRSEVSTQIIDSQISSGPSYSY